MEFRNINLINFAWILVLCSCAKEAQIDQSLTTKNPHEYYLNKANGNTIEPRTDRYTVTQAIDYLNDGLNHIYCRPQDFYLETRSFIDTFSVSLTGGEVLEANLINLFDDIAEFAGDNYHADTRQSKEPLLFYIRPLASSSQYVANVEATFLMEAGEEATAQDSYPYEDSWIYGQYQQNVSNECSVEGVNYDAADLLRRDLRRNETYRQEGVYYFRDPYVWCFTIGGSCLFNYELWPIGPVVNTLYDVDLDNPNDQGGDNLFDFLLFKNSNGLDNFDECLDEDEMNFYYESMADLANSAFPNPLSSRVVAQIELGYNNFVHFSSVTIWHSMEVMIVNRFTILEEEDYEAEPLPN